MTWALVPETPKEEMPARRRRGPVGLPGDGRVEKLDGARRPVDVGGGIVGMEGLGQETVL
jgi:hypothetical protein